ncbi:MAG: bifunctional phosphoserine phosphatase/homoserine phosphotransferase ThrH [Spirochaetia bacterium]|jgi:phosphoserine/homoserine phosphotransferase|nr:bifunctional phosphoserine phosphatase/homoserine phosphotransferase ThrH [Spirochaetia bacterium]
MFVVCLDLEGVLVPEIWINVAEKTGIDELKLTTRDISDYNVLMKRRIAIMEDNNLKLKDIQDVIATMDPLEGAEEFLENLRELTQVVILSDTFTQFAKPLMRKLGWPVIFCNELVIDSSGRITDFSLRQQDGKKHAVRGFHSMGLQVVASGDSYNDLSMIREADSGALFCPPEKIVKENPDLPVAMNHRELFEIIKNLIE